MNIHTILKLLLVAGLIFLNIISTKSQEVLLYPADPSLKNVIPHKYDVNLVLDISNDNIFIGGNVSAEFEIINSTRMIRLNCHDQLFYNIKTITLFKRFNNFFVSYQTSIRIIKYGQQMLDIYFRVELSPTASYILEIQFSTHSINEQFSVYKFTDTSRRTWTLWTLLRKPIFARFLFPCWDEPSFRAKFNISINHPYKYTALSNAGIRERSFGNDNMGMVWTHFEITPVISTYQLAIVLTDYINVRQTDDTVNIWHIPPKTHYKQFKFAEKIVIKFAGYMSTYIEKQQDISQINHIFVPDLKDENMAKPGLNIYDEQYIAYNEDFDGIDKKMSICIGVAQLTAYQWFDNMVSPSWWTDVWLTKTLAIFFANHAFVKRMLYYHRKSLNMFELEDVKCYHDMDMGFVFLFRIQYLARRIEYASHVIPTIYEKITTPFDIDNMYSLVNSSTCCIKEVALMFMLEAITTENVFREGINHYIKMHAHRSASIDDFWAAMDIAITKSLRTNIPYKIKDIIENYLAQSGCPVVYVERNYTTSEMHVWQPLLVWQVSTWHKEKIQYVQPRWFIPITYATKSKPMSDSRLFIDWLNPYQYVNATFRNISNDDWVIVNVENVGYYRVNYDYTNWKKIINLLNSSSYTDIHVLNRAHLIDDAYYFLLRDELEPELFLKLINYLNQEKYYPPWYSMNNVLSAMSEVFLSPKREYFIQDYILDILNVALNKTGFREDPDEKDSIKLKRLLVIDWACRLGHAYCRIIATTKLITDLTSKIQFLPWWKTWTPCVGIMKANLYIWMELLNKYHATLNEEILEHLACSEDPSIIIRYLNMMKMECKELGYFSKCKNIYNFVVKKHAEKGRVLDYILNKFQERPSNISMTALLLNINENIYSEEHVAKVNSRIMELYEDSSRKAKSTILPKILK